MRKVRCVQVMVVLLTMFCLWTAVAAQEPATILVVPFTVHSDQDLSFAQSAIRDMCMSRLTAPGKIIPIQKNIVDKELAAVADQSDLATIFTIGETVKADYVLWGSLTVLDKRISTDAGLAVVKTQQKVLSFSKSGFGTDEIISHVDLLSNEVLQVVLGRSPEGKQSKSLIGKDSTAAGILKPPAATIWKSDDFDTRISGIALGDVDGDTNNEIVMAGKNMLYVYRLMADNKFQMVAEIEENSYGGILGIDVADINHNGVAEIFVTRLQNSANRLASFVLEWDGSRFTKTVTNANWFYRVISETGNSREPILLGQEKSSVRGNWGENNVYDMKWEAGSYTAENHASIPGKINFYGMAKGNVEKDGLQKIVAFSHDDHLLITDTNGKNVWKSGEQYGGSNISIDYPSPDGDRSVKKRIYLPHRIHIADLDGNGKNEIIVVKNKDALGRFLSKQRSLENGQIFGLEWNYDSLKQVWQSPVYTDYISDYAVGDANNDGRRELLFAVVSGGGIFEDLKSYIVVRGIGK